MKDGKIKILSKVITSWIDKMDERLEITFGLQLELKITLDLAKLMFWPED